MPRMKKLNRTETHNAIITMIDLGFTPNAVALGVNKTPMAIYGHLNKVNRIKNRTIIRKKPRKEYIDENVITFASRFLANADMIVPKLVELQAAEAEAKAKLKAASAPVRTKPKVVRPPKTETVVEPPVQEEEVINASPVKPETAGPPKPVPEPAEYLT